MSEKTTDLAGINAFEQKWQQKKQAVRKKNTPVRVQMRMASWLERKDLLLATLSSKKAVLPGNNTVNQERIALASELDSLEAENSSSLDTLQKLQNELTRQRSYSRTLYDRVADAKSEYLQTVSEESSLRSEIDILGTEKIRVTQLGKEKSHELEQNMDALDIIVDQISFVRGELEVWSARTGDVDMKIPEQYQELSDIDAQIKIARDAISDLSERLQLMELNVKKAYYNK